LPQRFVGDWLSREVLLLGSLGYQRLQLFPVLQLPLSRVVFLFLLELRSFFDLCNGLYLRLNAVVVDSVSKCVLTRSHLHFVVHLSARDHVSLGGCALLELLLELLRLVFDITELFLLLDAVDRALVLHMCHLVL